MASQNEDSEDPLSGQSSSNAQSRAGIGVGLDSSSETDCDEDSHRPCACMRANSSSSESTSSSTSGRPLRSSFHLEAQREGIIPPGGSSGTPQGVPGVPSLGVIRDATPPPPAIAINDEQASTSSSSLENPYIVVIMDSNFSEGGRGVTLSDRCLLTANRLAFLFCVHLCPWAAGLSLVYYLGSHFGAAVGVSTFFFFASFHALLRWFVSTTRLPCKLAPSFAASTHIIETPRSDHVNYGYEESEQIKEEAPPSYNDAVSDVVPQLDLSHHLTPTSSRLSLCDDTEGTKYSVSSDGHLELPSFKAKDFHYYTSEEDEPPSLYPNRSFSALEMRRLSSLSATTDEEDDLGLPSYREAVRKTRKLKPKIRRIEEAGEESARESDREYGDHQETSCNCSCFSEVDLQENERTLHQDFGNHSEKKDELQNK